MTLPKDIHYRSISDVAALLNAGEVNSVDLTKATLQRIDEKDSALNAFITVTKELALKQAEQADVEIRSGRSRGPLHGIPVAVKDLLVTKNIPTTFASNAYKDYVTDYDAVVVKRLAEAGAVLVGKTNLSEGAADSSSQSSAFGGPNNPWNTDYITGGSSGGSAAAVAAGLAFGAIGSDTAMSIRQPSALCGIVGLKPTYGLVPKHGAMTLSFSLDHLGPMTRNVRDAAIMLQTIAGYDGNDPTSVETTAVDYMAALDRDIGKLRIAVLRDGVYSIADEQWQNGTLRALQFFEGIGAQIEEVDLPNLEELYLLSSVIISVECAAFHAERYKLDPNSFGSVLRGAIEIGQQYSGVQYVQAQRARRLATEEFLAAFRNYDALVLPTTTSPACLISEDDPTMVGERMRNTLPFNALGVPAISVPAGFDSRGLPIGVQFVGQPFAEARLLQLAHAYEEEQGYGNRHPDI